MVDARNLNHATLPLSRPTLLLTLSSGISFDNNREP
jgi:hypothetical protein